MTTTLSSPPVSETAARTQRTNVSVGNRRAEKSAWFRWGVLATVLAVAGGGAFAAYSWYGGGGSSGPVDRFVVTPRTFTVSLRERGELRAARSTNIINEVEGRSTIISLIPEGTPVQKGDLLVTLASDQIDDRIRQEELKEANAFTAYEAAKTELDIQRDRNASDIRKALLEIELKHLELEKYEKGEWGQKLKDADIAIEQAKITLDRRKQDFEAAKELIARGFITETEYAEDEFNHLKAIWDLEKAEKAKEVLEQYTHVADLRQRQSDLEEARKEHDRVVKNAEAEEIKKRRDAEGKEKELALIRDNLAKLRQQKERSTILAPTQGFVVYFSGGGGRWMSDDTQIREGASVFERQVIMSLPDTSEMQVVVRIHEAKTNKLQMGQRAVVNVEGLPGREFTGRVTKIAVLADTQNRWLNPDLKEYETEITLDTSDEGLKPGVTAHAEILVETVEDRLAVPVQSVFSKGGRRYVFTETGGRIGYTEVQLGALGTEWAEVTSGVSEGDRIMLAFADEHKRLIPDLKPVENGNGGFPAGGPPAGQRPRRTRPEAGGERAGAQPVETKRTPATASDTPARTTQSAEAG